MSSESPPWATQASSYGAEQTRRAVFLPFASTGGVKAAGDLAVTAPVSGMTCNVATGEVLVPGSSSAIQGLYYGRVSSTTNLAVAASNPSNPRIDMVYAVITDSAYTGATNTFTPAVATGTATVGATLVNLTGAPALPTSAIILAYILVPAASTSVTDPNISDQRVRMAAGFRILASQVTNAADTSSASTQTFTGKLSTPALTVTGITGAVTQTRLVGGTASGPPVSGTFAVNDVVPSSDGTLRICTGAGSPGTFTQVGTTSYFTQIASTTLGSSAASIDFTSIPGTYKHLLIECQGRTDRASTGDGLIVRLNNDSGANYSYGYTYNDFTAPTPGGAGAIAQTSAFIGFLGAASATAGRGGGGVIRIPNYAGTAFFKQIVAQTAAYPNDVSMGGEWASTAAVTRVTLLPSTGPNFITGTTATLYGLS